MTCELLFSTITHTRRHLLQLKSWSQATYNAENECPKDFKQTHNLGLCPTPNSYWVQLSADESAKAYSYLFETH